MFACIIDASGRIRETNKGENILWDSQKGLSKNDIVVGTIFMDMHNDIIKTRLMLEGVVL